MTRRGNAIRILIADDHPIFRDGLRKLLQAESDLEVVGEATDGEEAIRLARQLKPNILLLDLAMPRHSGQEALQGLAAIDSVYTIVLTAAIERDQTVKALELGARGVVLKESATEVLLKSIRCVMAGQYWVGRESVGSIVQALRELMPSSGKDARPKNFGLTPRELEIIAAIIAGYPNKDIGTKFSISEQTVKHHLTNIFDKLGVSNRLELALFATAHHLGGQD